MYRIAWKSTMSDKSGNGEFNLTEEKAKEEIASLAKDFPLATYWYEADIPPLNLKRHLCSEGDMRSIEQPDPSPIYERPPPLNLKFINAFLSYISPVSSPVEKAKEGVKEDAPKVAKIKKTCSFGNVTIHEFPNLSPYSATPLASPVG